MPTPDDDMSLREIARTLSDFRQEFRSQVAQLVRADVYRAEQAADRARIGTLEKAGERDESDRSADRRLVIGAFVTAALSFIGSLLLVALTRH
jgi:hypothetical protein